MVNWFENLFDEGDYVDYEEDYIEVGDHDFKMLRDILFQVTTEAQTTKEYYPENNESLPEKSIRKGLEILNRGDSNRNKRNKGANLENFRNFKNIQKIIDKRTDEKSMKKLSSRENYRKKRDEGANLESFKNFKNVQKLIDEKVDNITTGREDTDKKKSLFSAPPKNDKRKTEFDLLRSNSASHLLGLTVLLDAKSDNYFVSPEDYIGFKVTLWDPVAHGLDVDDGNHRGDDDHDPVGDGA